jgi:hypothetical protein
MKIQCILIKIKLKGNIKNFNFKLTFMRGSKMVTSVQKQKAYAL